MTVVDLDRTRLARARGARASEQLALAVADGCSLPLPDGGVDFVFSNAVIEHLPPRRRATFAQEVRRVAGQGYLVTTPNFWFPFEPHYRLPLVQFLPSSVRHHLRWFRPTIRPDEAFFLLSRRNLRRLFPDARVEGLLDRVSLEGRRLGVASVTALAITLLGIVAAGWGEAYAAEPGVEERGIDDLDAIADILFSRYILPFEAASILLLATMIAVIALAKRQRGHAAPAGPSASSEAGSEATDRPGFPWQKGAGQ